MKSSTTVFVFALLAAAASLRAEDPATFEVSAFKFTRPAEWKWVETTSSMRKAQLAVPGKEGTKPAEMAFFHFGAGDAGGVDANVKRWLGQFQSKEGVDKVEPETLGGVKVMFVSTEGTFSGGGIPGGPPAKPVENYALLGAILDHEGGPVFVKMTGPVDTVRGAAKQFHAFIAAAAGAKP